MLNLNQKINIVLPSVREIDLLKENEFTDLFKLSLQEISGKMLTQNNRSYRVSLYTLQYFLKLLKKSAGRSIKLKLGQSVNDIYTILDLLTREDKEFYDNVDRADLFKSRVRGLVGLFDSGSRLYQKYKTQNNKFVGEIQEALVDLVKTMSDDLNENARYKDEIDGLRSLLS